MFRFVISADAGAFDALSTRVARLLLECCPMAMGVGAPGRRVYGRVGRRRGGRVRRSLSGFAATLLAVACGLSLPTEDDIDGAVDEAVDAATDASTDLGLGGSGSLDPLAILSALFPALSSGEIAEISASLSLDEILALRDELEAVREEAEEFSRELFQTSEERVAEREMALAPTGGFPQSPEVLGSLCYYDRETEQASLTLSGVLSGQTAIHLESEQVGVLVDGVAQTGSLRCLHQGESVDIVLLVDITGSMASVIGSVRDSVIAFTEAVRESGLTGTLSVVTFQDTVGVDVTFQEPAPEANYERSPFYSPIDIADSESVADLQAFVRALEANRGADAPENLAGAIDFARNSVIGGTEEEPTLIDGQSDPVGTRPFPALESERQVFIALTDITFHSDTSTGSSLLPEFQPRQAPIIAGSLVRTGTVVHVVDPSWVDGYLDPGSALDREIDADYWAIETGGLGEDVVLGYSLLDLELVAVAEDTGLLDVVLDLVLSSSCHFDFSADLSEVEEVEVQIEVDGEVHSELVAVTDLF